MMLAIVILLLSSAAAGPIKKIKYEILFNDCALIYNGSHDIVDIDIPFSQENYKNYVDMNELRDTIFFVEADIKENGDKDFKGVYVFKKGQAKKLLDNGQSVAFSLNYTAYFGAKDGIYKYNATDDTAEKIGNVTDSVIKMAIYFSNNFKFFENYYLTEDYVLYKFANDEFNKPTKVDAVKDARDFVFDWSGNLIFYDGTKQFYIYNSKASTVAKINGIKSNPNKIYFVKPTLFFYRDVGVFVDGEMYKIKDDGTSEKESVEFEALPTAIGTDVILWRYTAHNKKIYNVMTPKERCI